MLDGWGSVKLDMAGIRKHLHDTQIASYAVFVKAFACLIEFSSLAWSKCNLLIIAIHMRSNSLKTLSKCDGLERAQTGTFIMVGNPSNV